ncbi:hypothetical protein TCAL_15060 [Tigriopus californicus]|uniref:SEA domain-containing protein n=1 Tax=Tigriopus californicus TaxID=6832 RepID=A0A553NY18_TIGCA|nr:hypothetical protein TCAL_15060 [Tigriopus californicus]
MALKLRLTVGFALILAVTADHASVLLSNSVSVPVSTSYNAADSFASPSSSSSASSSYSSSDQSGSYTVEEESQPVVNTYSISSTDTKTTKTESAPSVSGTPFSGNLYYYYPVAAYPIADPISNKDSASSYGNNYVQTEDSNLSPLIYLLVPLVILIVAIPFLALLGVNVTGSRQFLSGRSKDLDEKFGSFSDLQREIDVLLEKYVNALESYQCKDRIVCELGVRAQGLTGKEMFFR